MHLCFIFPLSENSKGKKPCLTMGEVEGAEGPSQLCVVAAEREHHHGHDGNKLPRGHDFCNRQCQMESPVFEPAAQHTPTHTTRTSVRYLIQPICLQLPWGDQQHPALPWQGGTCPVVLDERLLPSHSRGSRGLRNRHCSPFLPSSLSTFRQGKGQHTRCLLLSSHPALSGHGTVRGRACVAQSAFSTQQHTSSAASGPEPRGHKSSPLFSYRRPKSPFTCQLLEAPGLSHLQTPAMSVANTSIHRNLQAVPQSCPNVVVCISFLGNMSPRCCVGAAHVSKI